MVSKGIKDIPWPTLPDRKALRFSFGTSVLSEIVLAHSPSAVLTELVQNEYDAGGRSLSVHFRHQDLCVLGTGDPIDSSGWKRLSVVLGTGFAGNLSENIQPKTNGIGSKNFGMRSLFLYGNEIRVRSNGKWTLLDITEGACPNPSPDPRSKGKRGVRIEVPFRTQRLDVYEPFSVEKEKLCLNSFASAMPLILLKLADPKRRKSLRTLTVTSERNNRTFQWNQWVTSLNSNTKGVSIFKRRVRVSDTHAKQRETIEELEFQKVIPIPDGRRDFYRKIPSYYRVRGDCVRIGLSIRMKRGKADLRQPGIFYYPLGMPEALTGCALNVSAPFKLNPQRSGLIDEANDTWNTHLLAEAAEFAFLLVTSDWFSRIGPEGLLAFKQLVTPSHGYFLHKLKDGLKKRECWPTQEFEGKNAKIPSFATGDYLVLPDNPELDGFLGDKKRSPAFDSHRHIGRSLRL